MISDNFPIKGLSTDIIKLHLKELNTNNFDYTNDLILNSICTPSNIFSKDIFNEYFDYNGGDTRIFSSLINIEKKTIQLLGSLVGNPYCHGTMLSGGTEANILALYVARERFYRKDSRKIRTKKLEVIAPSSVHYSVVKACKLLDLNLIIASLSDNQHASVESIENLINNDTIAIVATAGTSELGAIDNIKDIAKISLRYDKYFHVDAASGGFLIPFAIDLGYELPKLNMQIEGIDSLTIDPHKYGLCPISSGGLLFNSEEYLNEIKFESFFRGSHSQKSILGTKSGASLISCYATLLFYGYNGYLEKVRYYFQLREYFKYLLNQNNLKFHFEPDLNIVSLPHININSFVEFVSKKGIVISYSKNYECLRIVLNNNVKFDDIDVLLKYYIKSFKND